MVLCVLTVLLPIVPHCSLAILSCLHSLFSKQSLYSSGSASEENMFDSV